MSLTTVLEEEEIWIATLIVHDHTQPHSHSEQWKEMRRREWWVVGGIERWCRSVVYYRWFMSCCLLGVRDSYSFCCFYFHFEWMRWLFIVVVWHLVVVQSVLDSVVMAALYFLYNVVIHLLSWCCVLLSSSFVVCWEWGLYSQVVHSDPVGYLDSLSTCCSVIECIWYGT